MAKNERGDAYSAAWAAREALMDLIRGLHEPVERSGMHDMQGTSIKSPSMILDGQMYVVAVRDTDADYIDHDRLVIIPLADRVRNYDA